MKWRPKFLKYRKYQKLKKRKIGIEYKNYFLKYGRYGLKILQSGFITSWQLETIRRIITKHIKKKRTKKKKKTYILVYPIKGLTKKPKGVRMGKGKGKVFFWVAPVLKGKILLEFKNIKISLSLLKIILPKLPVRCIIVKRKI